MALSLVVYSSDPRAHDANRLVLVARDGSREVIDVPPRQYSRPRVSPDGRRVVVETLEATHTVWTVDLERRVLSRLTTTARHNPAWMPARTHVTFNSDSALLRQVADGSTEEEALVNTAAEGIPDLSGEWSRDGRMFAFTHQTDPARRDIWSVMTGAPDGFRRLISTRFDERMPAFSPVFPMENAELRSERTIRLSHLRAERLGKSRYLALEVLDHLHARGIEGHLVGKGSPGSAECALVVCRQRRS